MKTVNILGVEISIISLEQAVKNIERFVTSGGYHYICASNVHTVVMSQRDSEFRRITNEADIVIPDGMPLVWAARLLGYSQPERVDGPTLMLELCKRGIVTDYSHFFHGGRDGVPESLAESLTTCFPGLKVAGCYSPPFRALTCKEEKQVVKMINESGADILWVGLGAPKQEYWMARHLGRISTPVMIGVGAAFDFHSGTVKRAPRWMQKWSLEWLFRLLQDPQRLLKRYLVSNTVFIIKFAMQFFGLSRYSY